MQEPESTVAGHGEGHDTSTGPVQSGNGIHAEPFPSADGSTSIESPKSASTSKRPASPSATAPADEAMAKAVNDVLLSDIGVNTLLNRLKQSVASARDLAVFLKKRSSCEDVHAKELRQLCKIASNGLRGRDSRQGSYAIQFEEVIRLHDRIAENEISYGLNLHQMSVDIDTLAMEIERGRKHWKQTGLAAEQRMQEAERALEKAKQKYDSLAEDYDNAKTGDKSSGKHFGLRGVKSAEKHEEDLQRKLTAADQDYHSKVLNAQQQRQELVSSSRPQAVQALKQLIKECDAGVALQLQKFASFNEKLILGNGLLISPLNDGDSSKRSLRDIIAEVDNEKDFSFHVMGFQSHVPVSKEIKYEKHHTLMPPPQVASQLPKEPAYDARQSQPQQQPAVREHAPAQFPMGPQAPSIQPQVYQPFESPYESKPQPQPPYQQDYPPGPAERGYPYEKQPIQQNPYVNPGPYTSSRPVQGGDPGPLPSSGSIATHRPSSRGNTMPAPSRPVFGVNLQDLFDREQQPVPSVVYQCIQAVEHFGMDHEGIYRVSGNANQVGQLKSQFDHNGDVDFRNPSSFFNDVNNPATLLKQFFREFPDPLFTRAAYGEFLEAATVNDDTARRDRMHAIINNMPDPNYATLRSLTLHLHRISQQADQNRMTPNNLAVIFAPTLMGPHVGKVQDASLQHRVIETVLVNALQIFDED